MNTPDISGTAYLVDDDEAIRDALSWLFRSRGIVTRTWPSGEAFLEDYNDTFAGCLVLDIRMEGMSGLELFDALLERKCTLPVIFLTGHGDVPMAVSALKKGALDFVEKPFNDNDLATLVIKALQAGADRARQMASQTTVHNRLARLSQREREVMERILAGRLNKVIADELQIAMRTVEVHRARIFEKMEVKSAVELAQLLKPLQ